MKRLLLAVAIVIAILAGIMQGGSSAPAVPTETGADSEAKPVSGGDAGFARAFADRAGNRELEGQGTVPLRSSEE